jgi:hypothetical protein
MYPLSTAQTYSQRSRASDFEKVRRFSDSWFESAALARLYLRKEWWKRRC